MRFIAILILSALFLTLPAEPVLAIGLNDNGDYLARNALEAYCVNQGGYPKDGNCYFADGGYCELRSFYNGTCPGKAYYEQGLWMSEANNFLNGGSGSSYMPYYAPYNTYPNMYQSGNTYWNQNNNAYYYQPTYAPGYGMQWP